MTSEQLLATRATLWRQKGEPLLTLDDAQAWLLQTGLCLFLPRKAQIPAPAPSFVEACLGETNPTPPRAAVESAKSLVVRLIEANSALPLNLLGAPASSLSDHPDFLVSQEALPFVYALRGDRDWKHAPGTAGANRVSPLITHIWQLLERRGVLTAIEIQEELGKELTEAAVLRALHELWAAMRVIPLYQGNGQGDGQETLWEPMQSRHQKAMTAGVAMSQVTALSVLASVYLQSVVAASGDDAESFLSPLASRAKVREVIRGLSATRQLAMIQMETQSLLYVEGSLPEFAEAEKPVPEADAKPLVRRPHPTSPEGMQAALKRGVSRSAADAAPRPAYKRPAPTGEAGTDRPPARAAFRPANGRPDSRKRDGGSFRPAPGGARPAFKSGFKAGVKPPFKAKSAPIERSEPGTGLRADGSPKKTRWRDLPGGRPDQKGKPARFGPRKTEAPADGETPRPAPRREASSFRPATGSKPPYRSKPAFGSKSAFGSKPPFKRSSPSGEGRPFRPTGAGAPARSFRPTGPGAPAGRSESSRGTGPSRGTGSSRQFRPSGPSRGGRPSYSGTNTRTGRDASRPSTGSGQPFRPAFRPSGDLPAASGSRPPARSGAGRFTARPEGGRPYSKPSAYKSSAERPPREGSPGGDRKFTPRPPRAGGFSSTRPRTGESRPYTPRPGGRPPSGGSAGTKFGSGSSSRSGPGARSGGSSYKPGRPSGGSSFRTGPRPGFGQGPRPGAGRSGPASGRPRTGAGAKPGGPPKFKKRREPESSE